MIIEGKHAEVGQGIFVSDIQEGSAAEIVRNLILTLILINFISPRELISEQQSS